MKLDKLKFFILDECDKILDQIGKTSAGKSAYNGRHETSDPKHFLQNRPQKASHDVLSHSLQGNHGNLQKVHEKCKSSTSPIKGSISP
jgi:hypothetical protein